MMRKMMAGVCFLLWVSQVAAAVSVTDDEGHTVTLPQPAQRIVSLSPHVTEMVYAIGAGDRLVAVTSHSDYPEQARALPVVASMRMLLSLVSLWVTRSGIEPSLSPSITTAYWSA